MPATSRPSPRTRRPKSLSHGRPTASIHATPEPKALAARHTRRLIRQHHTLHKQRAAALAAGKEELANALGRQIDDTGGLAAYQLASRTGQSRERGGDASAVLMGWLIREGSEIAQGGLEKTRGVKGQNGKNISSCKPLRMLDVGALTIDTAASRSGMFESIVRIDLRSREKGILEQDFMERSLPKTDEDRFDVVSLSLVLNYVPDALGRGEMLKRVRSFLRHPMPQLHGTRKIEKTMGQALFPCLFIVLPAPCVLNSRYLTGARFEAILQSLGYSVVERKTSAKLVYFLCVATCYDESTARTFKKIEVEAGKGRNNFAIALEKG